MLAAACSEADEQLSASQSNQLTTIYSGNGRFTTRAVADSKWENGDQIGVFMSNEDGTILHASNVQFSTTLTEASATAKFTAVGDGITLVNDKVKFFAYYPYSASQSGTTYTVQIGDQNNAADMAKYDLRWAGIVERDYTGGTAEALNLTFSHKLTYLRVQLSNLAQGVTVESVTVSGVNTDASFDLATGVLSGAAANRSVTLGNLSTEYAAVVVPTAAADLSNMKLTIKARSAADAPLMDYVYNYSGNLANGFAAGYQYLFRLSLGGATSGEATLDELEAELGGFNDDANTPAIDGTTEAGTEAVTEIKVAADITLAQLNEDLASQTGKIALVFDGGEYELGAEARSAIEFPAAVTSVTFTSQSAASRTADNQAKLSISNLKWSGELKELKFDNVEVIGNPRDYFISNQAEHADGSKGSCLFAADGVIEIKNCYFHDTNRIFQWSGNEGVEKKVLASFTISNSRMEGTNQPLFDNYSAAKVVLENSTFYNWTIVAKTANAGAEFDVQNCTLAQITKTPLECYGGSGTITYNNNISAAINTNSDRNLISKFTTVTAAGNYAAIDGDNGAALGGFSDVTGFDATMTQTALLPNFASDDLTQKFVPATGITVGDPRWTATGSAQ